MTLDEAIKHAEEVAKEYQRVIDTGIAFNDVTIDMLYCDDTEVIEEHLANYRRCAEEHRQLAKWLKDYKRLLELLDKLDEIITKQIDISNNQVECQTLRWMLDVMSDINAEASQRWNPVSEKMPKAGEYACDVAKYYLVQNEYGDMLVARYTHNKYWEQIYQHKPYTDKIVAWMPLPVPYRSESED